MTKATLNSNGTILGNNGFLNYKKGDTCEIIGEDRHQYTIRFLKGKHRGRETKVFKHCVDIQKES